MRLSSLSAKVLLAFLVVLATFGAVSTYGALAMLRLGEDTRRVASIYLPLRLDLHDLQTRQLNLVEQLERTDAGDDGPPGYVKSEVDLARSARRIAVRRLAGRALAFALDVQGSEEGRFLGDIVERLRTVEARFAEDEELFDHVYGPKGARSLPLGPLDRRIQQTARERLIAREGQLLKKDFGELNAQLRGRVEQAERALAREERRAVLLSVLLGLLAAGLSVGVMLAVQRAMRPLTRLAETAQELGRGNLRQRVPASGTDEVAQLAREFNAMASALEERESRLIRSERLAAVGRIAAQITHEVRNPLSSIGLNAELLEEELDGSPEARKLAQAIVREVDRLAAITEEYLRFARLPRPTLEPEAPAALVASLLTFLGGELAARGVEVEADLPRNLPLVLADENQIRQALLNIVRNAAEAMPGGGRLRVLATADDDRAVTIRIADTGCGIAPDQLAKIFDPFFTTKEKGTGLGLALTQQIIADHGGTVDVQSSVPGGTTFTVRLPRAEPAAPPAASPPADAAPAVALGADAATNRPMSERQPTAAEFDTYDDFVKGAIKEYYDRGWASRKGNFIALVIASGQVFSMAKDQVTGEGGLRNVAIGAASVVALRVGLRFVAGPLGLLLTAASVASLAAFLARNQKDIAAKAPRYRDLLGRTRTKFDEIQGGYRGGRYDARERNLMVDGLQKRFLAELDEV